MNDQTSGEGNPRSRADVAVGAAGGRRRSLTLMEAQDQSDQQLTDEQVAEVRRRFADKNSKYVSLADVRAEFGRKE